MDVLTDLLRTFHLSAQVFLHASFCGRWAVDTSGDARATFHLIVGGVAWLHLPSRTQPVLLRGGDLVVFPHDVAHTLSYNETPPDHDVPLNQPNQAAGSGPETTLICGYFAFDPQRWNPLLNALPAEIILRAEETAETTFMEALIQALAYECRTEQPGASVVIDRLAEILFIHVVRTYMRHSDATDSYIASLRDPQISRALKLIHEKPGDHWSVEKLASQAGMSRAAFATRFQQLVSMPPMQYLSCWRMQRALGLLQAGRIPMVDVAEKFSYRSEAAFAKAFKRHFGYGPGKVRREKS